MSHRRGDNLDKDLIFQESFNDLQSVLRKGAVVDLGDRAPIFSQGSATFDADGDAAWIEYPRDTFRISEPERPFSIRTKVYLTDTDASVFLQFYISGADLSHKLRFMIAGNWPNAASNDKFVLELWDSNKDSANEDMRGRTYDQVLTTLALNKWTDFVATYDGRGGPDPEDGICLYMDGVRVDDANITHSGGGGDYSSMINHSDLVPRVGQNVSGKMEVLEVYNKVLTPEEVANLAGV